MAMSTVNESVLELIPEAQLRLQQVPEVKRYGDSWVLPTYRFRRLPNIEDLKQLTGLWPIWQANETLILTWTPCGHLSDCLMFHDHLNGSMRSVTLAYDDRYCLVNSNDLQYTIMGKSDQAIAETAAFLWGLENAYFKDFICVAERFNFGAVSLKQLAILFVTNWDTQVTLKVPNISLLQSKFLAQLPFPISLHFPWSLDSFSDGGHTFVESLLQRDSPFGWLKLREIQESHNDTFARLLQASAIDKLFTPRYARPHLIRQLCASSINDIDFMIRVEGSLDLDCGVLAMRLGCDSDAHIDFISSFFRRLAELGDFEELEFKVDQPWDTGMPSRIAEGLIRVVAANQNLRELRVFRAFSHFGEHLEDFFAAMEQHQGLCRFEVDVYRDDPDYALLKKLLKRNIRVEVAYCSRDIITDGDEIDQIYAFNRFFIGSASLTQEPLSLLPPFLGMALTSSRASGDFRRSALLMASHTHALCELLQYSSLASSGALI